MATLKICLKIPIVPKGLYPRPDLLTLWTSNRIRALGSNEEVITHLVEQYNTYNRFVRHKSKKNIKNLVSPARMEDTRLRSETGSKGIPQRHGSHMAPRVQISTLSSQYNCPAMPCDAQGKALLKLYLIEGLKLLE
jgi:hypothetical protein